MPRTKEFDEAEVLDRALELFRARGFAHTSFEDLTDELGVSRQSLYDTYGDKHTLYLTALKSYVERSLDFMRRNIDGTAPVREAMSRLFEGAISNNCSKGSPGCLMVNSMVELAPHDGDIRALAQAHAREFTGHLASMLGKAQRRGEIDRAKDPVALAAFFFNTMLGLSVAARALGGGDSLRQSAQLALRVLD